MKKEMKGALLAIFGGTCWGLSGSVGQYLFNYEGMDSRWLVPIRLGLAGIILLIYCFVRSGKDICRPWQTKRNAIDLVIYGLCGISFCQFLYFLTIQLSNAGTATILQDLSPIFILAATCYKFEAKTPQLAVESSQMEHKKPTSNEILAIILAMMGIVLITTHGSLESTSISLEALLSGIACAFCVMIYNVLPKKLLAQFPVTLLQGWAFLMGGIFFAFVFQIWKISYIPSLIGILGIAFVVIVGNILAFTCYLEGVHLIGPSKAILYGFSEPITAAVVTFIFMDSTFTIFDGIGFLCVFMMLVLISRKDEKVIKKEKALK